MAFSLVYVCIIIQYANNCIQLNNASTGKSDVAGAAIICLS